MSDVAELHVLIPDGKTWRILAPSALPADAPEEFRKALYLNLTRDWDHFLSGATCEAGRFAGRWPDFVQSLPEATQQVRRGYVLAPDGKMNAAVELAVIPPGGRETFFDMLIVPSKEDISSLFLRELLNGDKGIGQDIQKAFNAGNDLGTLMEAIKSVSMRLPVEIRHQVRIAVEHNAMRHWLLSICERIACQRGCFFTMAEKYWHLAHALGEMLDHEQCEE